MKRQSKREIAFEILGWLLSSIVLIPLYLVVINSLKDRAGANLMNLSIPKTFHFKNYLEVITRGKLVRSFFNSMLISSVSVIIGLLSSSTAAYILSRRRIRLNKTLYYFFLLGLVAPINMVTVIKTLQIFHIMNTYIGIIMLFSSMFMPFNIFLYYGFVESVPRSLEESAVLDGAGAKTVFIKIVFPLLKPVNITILVLCFISAWNDFIFPLYILNRTIKWPMTLAVFNYYGQEMISNWHLVFADMVLTILPVVIIYLISQKYIVSGMSAGALKG